MSSLIQPSKILPGFYKRSSFSFLRAVFNNPIAYTLYIIICVINEVTVPFVYISSFITIFLGLVLYIFTSYPTLWDTAKQQITQLIISGILNGSFVGIIYSIICLITSTSIINPPSFSVLNEIMPAAIVLIFFRGVIDKCIALYNIHPSGHIRNVLVNNAVLVNLNIFLTLTVIGFSLVFVYSYGIDTYATVIKHNMLITFVLYISSVLCTIFGCVVAHQFVQECFNIPKYQPVTTTSALPSYKEHQFNVS
jgi:hypothetical protein